MAQLLAYENFPCDGAFTAVNNGRLRMMAVNIPGSISFVRPTILFSASGTTAKTASILFGLYSLNAGTLSLANSASKSTNPAANTGIWLTLITSATQNITPGTWYFGVVTLTAGNSNLSCLYNAEPAALLVGAGYGGPFFRGWYSTTTNALPASINTTAFSKEGVTQTSSDYTHPYVLLSSV